MRKKHPKKHRVKKLGLIIGAASSITIIGIIAIFYFAVLVSAKPRSIIFITQKIESELQESFGENNVSVQNGYVSFTNYGSLKASIKGLSILYPIPNSEQKKSFIFPELEMEFGLLDLLLLNFEPKKVKIISPNIFLGDIDQGGEKADLDSDKLVFLSIFESIKKNKNRIETLEIENAKLTIRKGDFNRTFVIKNSLIEIGKNHGSPSISSKNLISYDEKKSDLDISFNCSISENLLCETSLKNLALTSLGDLNRQLDFLNQINASADANLTFLVNEEGLSNVKFKVFAKSGDFSFLDFFEQKMEFENFSVSGNYDHLQKILNLEKIETFFIDKAAPNIKPRLNMSLLISPKESNNQLDFDIKLKDVPTNHLAKFWPITLSDNGIRDWVSTSIKEGLINNASARFSLSEKNNEFNLENIAAEVGFAGATLKYSNDFPEIKNIAADAKFTMKDMKIAIKSGEVLQSKITEGLVSIDNFEAKNVTLKISGKAEGDAANGLQHANNNADFMTGVSQYLNGKSKSDFQIKLSLTNEITLKNSFIAVNSSISDLNNDYLKGEVEISSKKDEGTQDFSTKLDLTKADLNIQPLSISKKSGINSQLSLNVLIKNPHEIDIKNILLTKEEAGKEKESFKGSLSFTTTPFALTSASLKNVNFNKNNYSLTYHSSPELEKVFLSGNHIDISSFINQKPSNKKTSSNLNILISAAKADLLNKRFLRNFYLSLQCNNGLCTRGLLKANYDKKDSLNFKIDKASENYSINGQISDLGYIAEGLGISNLLAGGDAKIQIEHYAADKKPVFKGSLIIDDDITIFENESVKKLNKNTLFSQVRDKIFSSEKTTFDSVKVEFQIKDSVLDLRSMVANNFKIGITAKGQINLENNDIRLKGMIIPGYIVNSLFGIGKIPVVGGVISGILTGGEGGGLFGISYNYEKKPNDKEGTFSTNKVTAFVPSTIQNLFE